MKQRDYKSASVEDLIEEHRRLVQLLRNATTEREKEGAASAIARIRPIMRSKGIPISPKVRE